MKFFSRLFTPTNNRRLNELIGFLLLVSALLLFLALASYSPLDPSLNTASSPLASRPARNWIGLVGAYGSDLLLQGFGITAFLLPVFLTLVGLRWFRSRKIESPVARTLGCVALVMFVASFFGLLPWRLRWAHALPVEGLLGRVLGDALIHYFNLAGAYLVCVSAIAVALYLSTAFSFGALRLWASTRFTFVLALRDRYQDWQAARAKKLAARELEKRRAAKAPVVTAQLVPKRAPQAPAAPTQPATIEAETQPRAAVPQAPPPEPVRTGIEKAMEDGDLSLVPVSQRADTGQKSKTTLPKVAGGYKMPSTALLHRPDAQQAVDEEELKNVAQVLVEKCAEFDVRGQVTQINPGPVVTTFELKPEAGIKYSRITSLCDDLCLGLRAESILIERMPGKSTVGVQVPNRERETIWLREVVEAQEFAASKSRLTLALGKDINGRIVTADLATMPHLLIAGSTGSGKSVAINAMIMSILYKSNPDQVRLILVDPKRLELGNYEGVPHLYTPIITEPKLAANALRNAVREMERRLKLLAEKGVRNIEGYNKLFDSGETPSLFDDNTQKEGPIPYIVIIIDELADLMMLDGNNVEESITRLAQMARAVGIHLVLATQRPSVDVITGLIKANFPARISFRVATKVDSRTILDANGAEALLGRGDMLYLPSGSARVIRLHAPFVTEKEIAGAVEFWKAQGLAQYQQSFLEAPKDEKEKNADGSPAGSDGDGDENDELFEDAVRLVLEFGKASTSLLQRRLRIGYGRAAHLIDLMEKDGIVGAADGPKPREVLKRPDWLNEVEQSLR
ncbi:MAG TPA: DNA translocase FtsK 4TM domain-containing protein [Terriglobales bacterium]|nr:DNA translocase FtsK 4TM domain-containing protein [Terriglobales bacterium]